MTDNEKKKEYLRGYRVHVRRICRIEAELAELRIIQTSMSIKNDGMPRKSEQSDLSGYVSELDQLERNLKKEWDERKSAYPEITRSINKLQNENEKDVLFYRYITGLAWWEIAEKMGYSERQITRIHGRALSNIQIPKKEKMS